MAFTKAGLWGPQAIIDATGHPLPGATAALYLPDEVTLASLWTTSAKSVVMANPTQADIHANLHFYADPGQYRLKVTVGAVVTWLDVEVPIDPGEAAQDQDVVAAQAAAEAYADGIVAAAQAASQPLDSDLTAIAALSTTAFGRSFLALADAAAGQSLLGLGTAATQPSTAFDAAGAAAAAQAASQPLDSDLTAIAALSTTAFGRSVLTRVDAAALRTLAGTVIGTDVQAHDPDLDTIAALDSSTAGALSTDGAGWIRKTYAQLKTALGLVKADVGLGNADNTSDANKPVSTAQQAALDLKVATSGPTADLPFNSHKATGLADPAAAQDAATKAYVDAVAQGLSVKAAVRAASNTNHTLSAPGATVDGVTMVSGDRVLLRAQAAPAENGIWVWNGAAVAMTRATDADTSPEVVSGLYTFVTEGSTWASTGFALITPNPIVLDTTPLTFTPASGAGQIVAGTALTKTGNSLAVSDTELLALAGLTSVADSLPYFTGSGTAALTTLSAFIRSLLDDADAGTARTTLGLDTAATHPATDFAPSSGIAESAVTSLVTDLAAKSPILIPTAVKTGNYTAAIGDYVLCDTSGGIFTVTLPTAPADKTSIAVDLVASGNTLTIARGGADVFQKAGGPTSLTMNTANRVLVLQYQSATAVWHVQDHLPAVITTKGDLLTYGTERARLAVGADGALLGADSTQATGLKWIPSGTYVPGRAITADGALTEAADNTAAVNATVTAAGAGGVVWVPAGTFVCEGPIVPLSGQRILGPGTLKRTAASTHDLVQCTAVSDVVIDVALDGGYTADFRGGFSSLAATGNVVNISGGSTFVRVRGKITNNLGNAVRIFDSSFCTSSADVDNCLYGAVIGSGGTAADPAGVCSYNSVSNCTMRYLGKNGVYITGRTDSGTGPNPMYGHRVSGVTVFQAGDTGVEIGQGSHGCAVEGVVIDGNNVGSNGILLRDCSNITVSSFTIRNYPQFTNGNGVEITIGNGIFFWPQTTGLTTDVAISAGVIENCSRGVLAQGNNSSGAASSLTGGPGNGGAFYSGCSLTNVVVNGTQLGALSGSYAGFLTALSCHGFFLMSVSGFELTGCIAHSCQNDGFRIGDTSVLGSYCTDVSITGCRSYDNGQQAVGGQVYGGFVFNGAASQSNVRLRGCRAHDTRSGGARTQGYGFSVPSGPTSVMTDCSGSGNATGLFNGIGSDLFLAGTTTSASGNYTVSAADRVVIYTGAGGNTVTLPSAASNSGRRIRVYNVVGGGALTIAKSGGGTLYVTSLAAGQDHEFLSDGTNWY